jgi:hypothetical protein
LHFFKNLRVKKFVNSSSLSPVSPKSFFQKKKEKKKAIQGALAKTKGNGISPLGGAPKNKHPRHYAVVFWLSLEKSQQ